jgi:hypothetical protein
VLLREGNLVTCYGSVLQKTLLLFYVSVPTKKYKRAKLKMQNFVVRFFLFGRNEIHSCNKKQTF